MDGNGANGSRAGAGLRVADFMTARVFVLRERDSVLQARALLEAHAIRHAPVVDAERRLVGIVSDRDLLRGSVSPVALPPAVQEDLLRTSRVGDIMTTDVLTVPPERGIADAARLLFEGKLSCLPVVEGDRLVGILTESDFVRHFLPVPVAR